MTTELRSRRQSTINDVARIAGVSVSTASRVMRDHPDVSADTRARVTEVIKKLRYRPSSVARALVSGETRFLALLVSDIRNPFYPQLARAVELEARKHDYLVFICSTADDPLETRRYIEALLLQGLDGVIHASVADDELIVTELLADLRRIVYINRRPAGDNVSYVVSDNRQGARDLTDFLLDQGHRRIGFIGGPSNASTALERLAGFEDAMAQVADAEPIIAQGDYSTQSGVHAVEAWLALERRPTAILAINDGIALAARETLAERGLRVPGDIALAGFDGVGVSKVMELTTVEQQIDEMGKRAVQTLISQLGELSDPIPRQEVLPTKLVPRGSTAARLGVESTLK